MLKKFYFLFSTFFYLMAIFFLGLPILVNATTYYVDSTITDVNVGSATPDYTNYDPVTFSTTTGSASVYKTPADVFAKAFTAGDSILFRRGYNYVGPLKIYVSGNVGSPFTYGAFGSGSRPKITSATSVRGIDLRASNITISDLDVDTVTGPPVLFWATSTVGVRDTLENISISNIDVITNAAYAFTFSSPVGVSSNLYRNLQITNASSTNARGISSATIFDVNYPGVWISDLTISDSNFANGAYGLKLASASSTNLTLNNVTVTNNSAAGLYLKSANGVAVTNSTFTNNYQGFYTVSGGLVSSTTINNVSFSTSTVYGIDVEGEVSDFNILNSTVSDSGWEGVSFLGTTTDYYIFNTTIQRSGRLDANPFNRSGLAIARASNATGLAESLTSIYNRGCGAAFASGTSTLKNSNFSYNYNDGVDSLDSGYIICDHCIADHNGYDGSAADGDGYSWHGTGGGIIKYSRAFNNLKSSVAHVETTVSDMYYNVFSHDVNGTIPLVFLSATNFNLDNSTIVNKTSVAGGTSPRYGLYVGAGTGLGLRNNIVYSDYGVSIVSPELADSLSNLKSTAGSIVGFSDLTESPFSDFSAENYTLPPLSPAIDAGTSTPFITSTTTDYIGNPIYGTPDVGAYEYQPIYSITDNNPEYTANIRIYGDGKYRYTSATSTTNTAKLSVIPIEGSYPSYDASTTRPEYLNISDITWGDTKSWTASSSLATTTIYTVGDLEPGSYYLLTVDGIASSSFSSTDCVSNSCQAGTTTGEMVITYSGGYSTHTFTVALDEARNHPEIVSTSTPPVATNSSHSSGYTKNTPLLKEKVVPVLKISDKTFTRSLSYKVTHSQVKLLQQYLNSLGFFVSKKGAGSIGKETNYFGRATQQAVIKFQKANKIKPANGYFGPLTKKVLLNKISQK